MVKNRDRKTGQILWFGVVFCCVGLLFAIPCSAQKAPKGKAVVVQESNFSMNGGDPHTATSGAFMRIGYLIHEGLFRKIPDGRIVPGLAKSWEVAKDGLSIKFMLNERAKFHNGEPVTAEDVKFSIERASRADLKYRGGAELRRSLDRIEVKDTFGIYYITLTNAEQNAVQSVRCVFDSKHGADLNQLTKGQEVTVLGKYDGSLIDIKMKGCSLVH